MSYQKNTEMEDIEAREFKSELGDILNHHHVKLVNAKRGYGDSWKKRGGIGAYMMMCRKWDRLENRVEFQCNKRYDIFEALAQFQGKDGREGLLNDVSDLIDYLLLVEHYAITVLGLRNKETNSIEENVKTKTGEGDGI